MDIRSTGLIIGYGSIGRRHARVLAPLTRNLVIVNRRESVRIQAAQDHPAARVVDRLEALDAAEFPWNETVAVIATWGPSHAELFHALADRGVRHILCEKPMAASIYDATAMAARAEKEGIVLGVNHVLRHAGIVPALRSFFVGHELGEPVGFVVRGGAACLVTNGIHWLDFATELFEAAPQQVISSALGEPINPRAPELRYYGGSAVYSFGQGREAVIVSSNYSSIFPRGRVYLRDAVADIGYVAVGADTVLNVVVQRRNGAAVERFPAITRTDSAEELLFDGQLPGVREFMEGMHSAIDDVVHHRACTAPASAGVSAVTACIGALLSGREGHAIDVPIDPSSTWGQEHWPIS